LFLVAGPGALGALAYLVRLWLDWKEARQLGVLDDELAAAWKSKFRQSAGLCAILFCVVAFSLTSFENILLRYLLVLAIAIIGDWKVFKMFTDRFHADLQVAKKKQEEDDAAFT